MITVLQTLYFKAPKLYAVCHFWEAGPVGILQLILSPASNHYCREDGGAITMKWCIETWNKQSFELYSSVLSEIV